METLVNLSLLLGMILQDAAYVFLFCAVGLGIFYLIKKTPDSACHGDCNQGRNCNCKGE